MKTIEITTTQHVTIQYELASWGMRLMAFCIDWIIGLVTMLLFSMTLDFVFELQSGSVYALIGLTVLLSYTLGWEYFNHGQTPGKYIAGIKVVKLDGRAATLGDYLTRIVFRTLDIYLSLGSIATMLILSSPRGQRLGDINANTTVIQLRRQTRYSLADFERLNTLQDYEPQYPQVAELDDGDMLLIKNTMIRAQRYPNSAHQDALKQLQNHLQTLLDIDATQDPFRDDPIGFFKALLKDYIALTR